MLSPPLPALVVAGPSAVAGLWPALPPCPVERERERERIGRLVKEIRLVGEGLNRVLIFSRWTTYKADSAKIIFF